MHPSLSETLEAHVIDRVYFVHILIKSYNLVNDKIYDVDEKVDNEVTDIGFRIDDL